MSSDDDIEEAIRASLDSYREETTQRRMSSSSTTNSPLSRVSSKMIVVEDSDEEPPDTKDHGRLEKEQPAPVLSLVYSEDADDDVIELPKPKRAKYSDVDKPSDTETPLGDLRGPQLTFRLNRLRGFSQAANLSAVQLSDIINSDVKMALLTTYKIDVPWLMKECPVLWDVPCIMLHGDEIRVDGLPPNVMLRKPPVGVSYGVFHVLSNAIRVAVSSGNLVEADYHRKTNGIWVQDFPRRANPKAPQTTELAIDFYNTLYDYLGRCNERRAYLEDYDYSAVRVVLITSIPGFHPSPERYGHAKVRYWLSRNCLEADCRDTKLVAQCSSVGSFNDKWLFTDFGTSMMTHQRGSSSASGSLQFVWPTVDFVRNCIDGYMAGGSLCFNQKNNKPFLSAITHAYVPNQRGREAVPPHIKTYFRYKPDLTVPWFILTSANLSTGAWGNIQKQGTQIMMRNFEAGVLFLPSLVDSNATVRFRIGAHSKVVRTPNSIEVMFPVPCTTPPPKYTSEESSWVWDISHPKPDVMGQRWGED